MKLRWKHFLVLLAASLVPLLAVTWITQNASRRLGKTISGRARTTITDTVRQEMVRATRSYATLSLLGEFACEQSIQRLAAQAEFALVLPPHDTHGPLELAAGEPQLAVERLLGQPLDEPIGCVVLVALARKKLFAVPVGSHAVKLFADPPVLQVDRVVPVLGQQKRRPGGGFLL